VKRAPVPDSDTPARSKTAIDRLIARREVHLRGKTLWRMLYETCARAEEILGLNIGNLDLAGRRTQVKAKGAQPKVRRRGQRREDFVLETVFWDAGTARLLPRLLRGRLAGRSSSPIAVPGPARSSGRATSAPTPISLGSPTARPAPLLDRHTAAGGVAGTGWDLHEWRHSGLTHLGEGGASLPMLMARSRHRAGERPALLPSLGRGDRRGHQPARARRQ
jgi:integrase